MSPRPKTSDALQRDFFEAAHDGDLRRVMRLSSLPSVDVDGRPHCCGYTALTASCVMGHVEIARFLADHPDVDINRGNRNGFTPLLLAAVYGHVSIVRHLLSKPEIQVNKQPAPGDTALHQACWKGHLEVVKCLCRHPKIDLNIPNKYERSPLFDAVIQSRLDVVEYLLTTFPGRINVNAKDINNDTPLHCACLHGGLHVVKSLVECPGIDLFAFNNQGQNVTDVSHARAIRHCILSAQAAHTVLQVKRVVEDITARLNTASDRMEDSFGVNSDNNCVIDERNLLSSMALASDALDVVSKWLRPSENK